jgi:putative NADH-flavin reductase
MKATGVRRLVVFSVAVLFEDVGFLGTALRRTFLRGVADDSAAMEQIVRASDLDWTIVRPPRLINGPRTERYAVRNGSLPDGAGAVATVRRSDLADFLIDEVERAEHVRQVVGIASSRVTMIHSERSVS